MFGIVAVPNFLRNRRRQWVASLLLPCLLSLKVPAQTFPFLDVKDAAVLEGNSGTTNLIFTLTLSKPASETVMVDYATRDGSAMAGSDYSAAFGVAIFPPGITSQEILVSVNGDTLSEADEIFWLMLTNAVNATLLRERATGTILNDDSPPALSINDVSLVERYTETTNAIFNVSLSAISGQTITVDYITRDGSAISGSHFVPVSDMLTFVPGVTRQTLAVPVTGGNFDAVAATFSVSLLNPMNASIGRNHATATITTDGPLRTLLANRHGNAPAPADRNAGSLSSPTKSPLALARQLSALPAEKPNSRLSVQPASAADSSSITNSLQRAIKPMNPSVANNSLALPARHGAHLSLASVTATNWVHVEQACSLFLAITNHGPDCASGVLVTNRLPTSATFLSAQTSQGTYARVNDLIVFNLGTLSNSSSATATIALKFSAAGLATNITQVIAAEADPGPTNNVSLLVVQAVNDLPKISIIPGQVTRQNVPTAPIPFVVKDTETPSNELIVFGASSNTNLVPDENFIFGGTATNRSLILVPAPNRAGATDISLTALDSEGGEAKTAFTLTVVPAFRATLRIEAVETASQPPKIDRIERQDNRVKLYFNAELGQTYAVECCDSLSFDAPWQTLTNMSASGTSTLLEFSEPIGDRPHRFFRLNMSGTAPPSASPVKLSFDAMPGEAYTIEYCDSLGTALWHPLTNIGPFSSQSTITISDSTVNQPQRFYRLRSP